MKAAVCHAHGQPLVIEEVEIAPPAGSQVRIKVAACAICHSDIHYAEGAWGGHLPAVYGHEAAGVVTETGPDVATLRTGDRVIATLIRSCGSCFYCDQGEPVMCGEAAASDSTEILSLRDGTPVAQGMKTGAFAEWIVVEESQTAKLDADIPLDTACLLACGVITGVGAVMNTARVRPGSHVVVIGTGGVGLNAVQGAAISGAQSIIAIDREDSKLEAARSFGATHGIRADAERVPRRVRALTDGRGADYVFVTVGAREAMETGYRLIRRGGEVIIVGMTALDVKSEFLPLGLAGAVQSIRGSFMGQTRLKVDIPRLLALYRQGRLKLDELVSHRYPLERINEAMEDTLGGRSLRNVLVIDDSL